MNFSQCSGLLVLAAIFLGCFAGNSNAETVSHLKELSEIEKTITSRKVQEMQESIIMGGSDTDSKAAQAAIKAIRAFALKPEADDNLKIAMGEVKEAILTAVRLASTNEHSTSKLLDTALKVATQDPDAAIALVKKAMAEISDYIYIIGVPIEDGHGAALAVAGGSNEKALKMSMTDMQNAGANILESLKIAAELIVTGIKAGGDAIDKAFKAARKAIDSGAQVAYQHCIKSAQHAFEGPVSPPILNQADRVQQILQSLKSNVSIESPAALATIGNFNKSLASKSKLVIKQPQIDAANTMTQALTSTVLETAEAVALVKKGIQKAGELACKNPEAAIAAVQKVIRVGRDEIIHGATIGFLGFGAARQIHGAVSIEPLIPAMIEIIMGRIEATENLKLAASVATNAFGAGGPAIEVGVEAALQICEAAESVLYAQFEDGAKIGLDVFF